LNLYTERNVVTLSDDADRSPGPPVLRVMRGDASPEEIAALVAVLMSSSRADDEAPPSPPARSAWADRSSLQRRPLHPGAGAWRRSGLPG